MRAAAEHGGAVLKRHVPVGELKKPPLLVTWALRVSSAKHNGLVAVAFNVVMVVACAPSSKVTLLLRLFATAMSSLPSPLKSPEPTTWARSGCCEGTSRSCRKSACTVAQQDSYGVVAKVRNGQIRLTISVEVTHHNEEAFVPTGMENPTRQ